MNEAARPALDKDSLEVNLEVLKILIEEVRHQQNTTFSVMAVFMAANAGLLAAFDFLAKSWGENVLAAIGLSTVAISFLSAVTPRRQWFRTMRKAFDVQEGLKEAGIRFIENPCGSKLPQGGQRTTHLVHLVAAGAWGYYLWLHFSWAELAAHLPH